MTSFEKIYEEYFIYVYKYILAISQNESLAEEITQESFFKALKSIDSFQGKSKIQVWLCQIAKNTYYSYLKKQKKQISSQQLETISHSDFFETQIEDKELAQMIYKHFLNLSEPYREVFSLRTFGQLSFVQIGELFNKTDSWARVTYYRAKSKLREDLDESEL